MRALEVIDEGNGPTLVALGAFRIYQNGSLIGQGAAKLTGEQWLRLGSFTSDATVHDTLVFDDGAGPRLFVAGERLLQSMPGILRWNGTQWESFGDFRPGDRGFSLAAFDDGDGPALYVGGAGDVFSTALREGLARWDGQSTTPISGLEKEPGNSVPLVLDLIAFGHDGAPALIATGQFTVAGESTTNLAAWNGKTWSSLGGASTGLSVHLAAFNEGDGEQLLAAGWRFSPPGLRGLYIASWDGASWSALGNGAIEPAQALASYDDGSGTALYAAGQFLNADSTGASTVARWDGGAWRLLGGLFRTLTLDGVRAIAGFDDGSGPAIFAAGEFILPGEDAPTVLAKWDGAQWTDLAPEFSGVALSLIVFDDKSGPALYIGGDFEPIGAAIAPCIARWDGAALTLAGDGLQGAVEALAVFDDGNGPNLYAGGQVRVGNDFTQVGIGRWDGVAWSTVGNGLPGDRVRALAAFEQDGAPSLFAGGVIEEPVGSIVARNLMRWDGAIWQPVGPVYAAPNAGVNGTVFGLEVFDNGTIPALYVAGAFSKAGDKAVPGLARWTGSHWTAPWTESVAKGSMLTHDFGSGPTLVFAGSDRKYPSGDAYLGAWSGCDGPRRIDLNLDGVVDQADIAVLVESWGACPSCVADLDGDGIVDGRDLGLLLGAW